MGLFDKIKKAADVNCPECGVLQPIKEFNKTQKYKDGRQKICKECLIDSRGKLEKLDKATENGLSVEEFTKRMLIAISKQKFEAYIGKKETMGVFLKRFFPKLLHKTVMKSEVR